LKHANISFYKKFDEFSAREKIKDYRSLKICIQKPCNLKILFKKID